MFENVLSSPTKSLLKNFKEGSLPKGFYLAGGTAVALYLGHRRSADLDFFTPSEFVEVAWEEKLKEEFRFKLFKRDWQTLIGSIGKVKFSLLGYKKYKQIAKKEKLYGVFVASLPDLSAMKLDTVIARGTKRDLIDIYFLAQKFSFGKLFEFYQDKYGNLPERELMIKKALVFFEEADKEEVPEMLIAVNWEEIKRWFSKEVKNLKS